MIATHRVCLHNPKNEHFLRELFRGTERECIDWLNTCVLDDDQPDCWIEEVE